jgi:hypothetical protein
VILLVLFVPESFFSFGPSFNTSPSIHHITMAAAIKDTVNSMLSALNLGGEKTGEDAPPQPLRSST